MEEEEEEEEENFPNSGEEINGASIYFGVSCAFLALQLMSGVEQKPCFEEIMLRGSAQLLGLLFEKAQRRHEAARRKERKAKAMLEVMELKQVRAEDAKANERVMSIFAAREQSWQAERRQLLNQIQSLFRELSLGKLKKTVLDLDLEEQRKMEAEKQEVEAMLEKLSAEFVELEKDAEQKGKIVSAMLRKAKHDTAEKQGLLKEVKIARAKKKQAELEAERWKSMWEEAKQKKSYRESSSNEAGSSQSSTRLGLRTRLLEYLTAESIREHGFSMIKPLEFQVQCLSESDDNLIGN